jgi:hypothetical protein
MDEILKAIIDAAAEELMALKPRIENELHRSLLEDVTNIEYGIKALKNMLKASPN